MRSTYTIQALVKFEIDIDAEDDDDAIEKSQGIAWKYWEDHGADLEIREVHPIKKEKHNASD